MTVPNPDKSWNYLGITMAFVPEPCGHDPTVRMGPTKLGSDHYQSNRACFITVRTDAISLRTSDTQCRSISHTVAKWKPTGHVLLVLY